MLAFLYRREIRNRYVGSISGMFWALLHPLLLLGVYTFIFTIVFRPPELKGQNYLLFVAIGLWPWLAFQEALLRGTVAINNYAGLIKKVALPHEIIIYANVGATFSLHLAGFLVVMSILWATGHPLVLTGLPLALGLWVLLLVAACGVALFFGAIQVFLRDTEHVLNPSLQILFFLAPILYPLSLVPQNLRPLVESNPMTYVIVRLREALQAGQPGLQWGDGLALLAVLVVFFGGRIIFLRLSPYFEDFV